METVLPLRRIDIRRFSEWAQKHLKPTDTVVIEATVNTWTLYDIVEPLVGSAVVANAYQVKLIAAARVKTDKHDVWSLARLLAIARKLLVVVWHVLTGCVADRKADEEMVAFKLMMWSWKLGKERRGGLTTPQFVRAGLMRLEMGEDLTHIIRGGTVRPIASAEEVLALEQASA